MSFPYKNPITASQLSGSESVTRTATFGTNFSVLQTGGFIDEQAGTAVTIDQVLTCPGWREGVVRARDAGLERDVFALAECLHFRQCKNKIAAALPQPSGGDADCLRTQT